jgi:hypothetical protein
VKRSKGRLTSPGWISSWFGDASSDSNSGSSVGTKDASFFVTELRQEGIQSGFESRRQEGNTELSMTTMSRNVIEKTADGNSDCQFHGIVTHGLCQTDLVIGCVGSSKKSSSRKFATRHCRASVV